jgi:hypothetical protein
MMAATLPRPREDCAVQVGAKEGWCGIAVAEGTGKEHLPLRSYVLLLIKGDRQCLVIVTRTQHPQEIETPNGGRSFMAFMGSPDGDALARGVMRSIRITP